MLGDVLFDRYLLDSGTRIITSWTSLKDADVLGLATALRAELSALHGADAPSQAVTKERLICPVLRLLGWDLLPEQEVGCTHAT